MSIGLQAGRPSASKNEKERLLRSLAEDDKPVSRVNFDLPTQEHRKLKAYAARTGQTISDIMRNLVAQIDGL